MSRTRAFSTEEKKVRLEDLALARALIPYVRPYAWMLVLTTLLVFSVTGFELIQPWLIQKAIDGFILPADAPGFQVLGMEIQHFSTFCIGFAVIILAGFVLDFSQSLFMEYTGQKIMLNLRCRLFAHMTDLPVAYFDKNSSGRLVARVAGDIENMNEMFTNVLVFIFKDLMLMAGIFVILFFTNKKLTLYLSVILPVTGVGVFYFSGVLRQVFRTMRQKYAEINHWFSEAVSGIRVIQTSTAEHRFIHEFKKLNKAHFRAAMAHIRIFAVFMPMIGFMGTLAVAVIIWSGSFMVADGTLTIGGLTAFLTYMRLFFRPLRELSEKFNLLQNALASAERVITVLNTPKADVTDASSSEGGRPVSQPRNPLSMASGGIRHLAFESVDFSYTPGVPVLKDIRFALEKGGSLGIVGHTGSGKSTMINLATGFYRPSGGRILINKEDYQRYDIADIRRHTALVMQDPILFSGTVRQNISGAFYLGDDKDDSRLEAALEKANCTFLFDKFSGLDTRLKKRRRAAFFG